MMVSAASFPRGMFGISAGLRIVNTNAAGQSLLLKQLPSSSLSLSSIAAADYYSSATALKEREDSLSLYGQHRSPTHLDVSAGGGPRPRKPRIWRTKTSRGAATQSQKLVDLVNKISSNSKDDVYGALDAWIAWNLDFPLIAVKKALKKLKDQEEWRRIIQVCKWMLEKGHGRTNGTYGLLLQALDHEGRVEEAEVLWNKLLQENSGNFPRTMYCRMIAMLDRYGKKKELLKVWVDMDDLDIKADPATIQKVARAYSHYGYDEVGKALLERPIAIAETQIIDGKLVEVQMEPFRDRIADSIKRKEKLGVNDEVQDTDSDSNESSSLVSHDQGERPRPKSYNKPGEKLSSWSCV